MVPFKANRRVKRVLLSGALFDRKNVVQERPPPRYCGMYLDDSPYGFGLPLTQLANTALRVNLQLTEVCFDSDHIIPDDRNTCHRR